MATKSKSKKKSSSAPPVPKKGVNARGARRQYLECPEDLKRVEYLLNLEGIEEYESQNGDEYVGFQFKILETDHPKQKVGSEVSKGIPKRGSKFSSFWDDFAPLAIALEGGDPSQQEEIDEFTSEENADDNYERIIEEQDVKRTLVRCVVYRYAQKKDPSKTSWGIAWEPATKKELKEYKDA